MQNNRCHRVKCLSVDNVRMAFNSMSSVSLFHCYSKMVFIFSSTRLIHSIVRHLDSTLILCKFLVNMQSKRLCVSSSSKKIYMAESPLYWKQLNSIRFCVCGVPHPLDWHTLYMNHRNMIEMYFTFNCNLFAFEFHSSAKSMTSERAVFIMDSSFRFNDCFFFVSFAIQLITILPNLRNIYLFDTHIMTPVNCESFCL